MEFTVGQVGPMAARQFALLGAQVIKVESRTAVDGLRIARNPITLEYLGPDEVARVNYYNLNKNSLGLNLKKPEAIALVKRLIAISDVMIDNFAAGVIDRLGLGYDVVKELRPDIVMVSASGSGRTGPEGAMLANAPIFGALSGLGELTGYPDDVPHGFRGTADAINGMTVFFSVMAALLHRKRTGQGQYIDYSSREGLSCLISDALMDYTLNGHIQGRQGNQDDLMAPHNCYRCQGQDKWLSVAIGSEEEWQALVKAMGSPAWSQEARFGTMASRKAHEEELDRLVQAWTVNYTHYQAMAILQPAGVAAFPSFSGEDVFADAHLQSRELFEVVEHPCSGPSLVIRCPWRLSATSSQIDRPGPIMGEHTSYILTELLGLSAPELARLAEAQVTR